jgi:methylenetetrahydrofolate dehydrogenase (NADP+)/methenyltetrahydrofolate cyclohydrolase
MTATIIDGKKTAALARADVADQVTQFVQETGERPGLATVLVGDDPASAVYVASKQRDCQEVGITPFDHRLPADATEDDVGDLLDQLNADPQVDGILLQLPLPEPLDAVALTGRIDPDKDVDGLTPLSAGRLALGRSGLRPCTPLGVMELLAAYDVPLRGVEAVVLGRSNLVGKPVSALLLAAHATVTTCHSRTRDLAAVCARADVLIAAVGVPHMVKADWVKPGATVIDVGQNRLPPAEPGGKGRLVGDCDRESVEAVAGKLTPVPGGVGPLTIAMLLNNTLETAKATQSEASRAAAR